MVRNIQEIKNPGGSNHFEQLVHQVIGSTLHQLFTLYHIFTWLHIFTQQQIINQPYFHTAPGCYTAHFLKKICLIFPLVTDFRSAIDSVPNFHCLTNFHSAPIFTWHEIFTRQ